MPTLLEIERAVRASLLDPDDTDAIRHIVSDGIAPAGRLSIYRNTVTSTLVKALRLNFPAVEKLVGPDFFEAAARHFIEANPPRTACLDDYGESFSDFLSEFPPAASLAYLADVARLEWVVSRVLHAPDGRALDITRLSALSPQDQGRLRFAPNPAVGLVHASYPADEIWRAVLAGDDAAMAAIDPNAGPVWLTVRRETAGVEVARLEEAEARFLLHLIDGTPLDNALALSVAIDAPAVLAKALADGLFADFDLEPTSPSEASR
jgi:hypothetical protein